MSVPFPHTSPSLLNSSNSTIPPPPHNYQNHSFPVPLSTVSISTAPPTTSISSISTTATTTTTTLTTTSADNPTSTNTSTAVIITPTFAISHSPVITNYRSSTVPLLSSNSSGYTTIPSGSPIDTHFEHSIQSPNTITRTSYSNLTRPISDISFTPFIISSTTEETQSLQLFRDSSSSFIDPYHLLDPDIEEEEIETGIDERARQYIATTGDIGATLVPESLENNNHYPHQRERFIGKNSLPFDSKEKENQDHHHRHNNYNKRIRFGKLRGYQAIPLSSDLYDHSLNSSSTTTTTATSITDTPTSTLNQTVNSLKSKVSRTNHISTLKRPNYTGSPVPFIDSIRVTGPGIRAIASKRYIKTLLESQHKKLSFNSDPLHIYTELPPSPTRNIPFSPLDQSSSSEDENGEEDDNDDHNLNEVNKDQEEFFEEWKNKNSSDISHHKHNLKKDKNKVYTLRFEKSFTNNGQISSSEDELENQDDADIPLLDMLGRRKEDTEYRQSIEYSPGNRFVFLILFFFKFLFKGRVKINVKI